MSYIELLLKESMYDGNTSLFYISKGFYDELEKENVEVLLWSKVPGVINITSSIEYEKEVKNILCNYLHTPFNDKKINIPEVLFVIDDKNTLMRVYDIFTNDNFQNKLESLINVLDEQPLKL